MKWPWFLALDVDDPKQALSLAEDLKDHVGGIKIGPRLALRYGQDFLKQIAEISPLFVDCKFHDIPSTMLAAVQSAFDGGASYVTVHASAGSEALRELAVLEGDLNKLRPFKILAVTVLTSFSEETLPSNWKKQSVENHVLNLASDVFSSGLSGLVCSPHELTKLRPLYRQAFLLTPGIRPAGTQEGDQKRVMDVRGAFEAGSSALVIGRPILQASDPIKAAKIVNREIEDSRKKS
ncbi:MAG: orotidine-5'-phosphate decarboxylase [Bdellovibrionales bacterium]|nr:orotidine-5'-phosphate decarboxylase [Bdellovibrionales bacterium]